MLHRREHHLLNMCVECVEDILKIRRLLRSITSLSVVWKSVQQNQLMDMCRNTTPKYYTIEDFDLDYLIEIIRLPEEAGRKKVKNKKLDSLSTSSTQAMALETQRQYENESQLHAICTSTTSSTLYSNQNHTNTKMVFRAGCKRFRDAETDSINDIPTDWGQETLSPKRIRKQNSSSGTYESSSDLQVKDILELDD